MSARPEDKFDAVLPASWDIISQRGEFFEANTDDTILDYQQTDSHLLIILSGKTTLVYLQEGKPAPTAIFRVAGEVLHHAGLHLKMPNPFRIVAVEDKTRVVMLDRACVYELIGSDTKFAEFLFQDLSSRFFDALGYLREQRVEPLIIRLAKRILTITEHRPSVELTQAELADIMAVTRISISKSIKTLEELGLLQRAERSLITVDRDKLRDWLRDQRRNNSDDDPTD